MKHPSRLIPLLAAVALVAAPAFAQKDVAQAGVTPDSWLYGFDTAYDSVRLALTFDESAKTDLALEIYEERAAETLEMSAEGKTKDAEEALDNSTKMLLVATATLPKIEDEAERQSKTTSLSESVEASAALFDQAIDATPEKDRPAFEANVQAAGQKTVTAVAAVLDAAPATGQCDRPRFDRCVSDRGCTEDTSSRCFVACPPISVSCLDPAPGKTCQMPDTACVSRCLQTLSGCFDQCRTEAGCTQQEASASTVRFLVPERIRAAFNLTVSGEPQMMQ